MSLFPVHRRTQRFRDGRVNQVSPDRQRGSDANDQDQQRGHQRRAPDSRQADENAGREAQANKVENLGYRHRNSFSATAKQTMSHVASVPICGVSCAKLAPCSMLARKASIAAVSGSALITG